MSQLKFFSSLVQIRRLPFYLIVLTCIEVLAFGQRGRGPVASSIGGAGVASNDAMEAAYFNPAAIANAQTNYLSLHLVQEDRESTEYKDWGVYAVDAGRESFIKGGLAYQKEEFSSDSSRLSKSKWEISGAKYRKQGFAMGASFTKQVLRDLNLETEKVDYNLDLGFLYNKNDQWSFGALFENVFTGKDERQESLMTLGLVYRLGDRLRYLLDTNKVLSTNTQWNYGFGLELKATDSAFWRLGYLGNKDESRNYYTGGFSWRGPRLGIHYAFQNAVSKTADSMHSLDFSLFF
ncbi:MAG: hypothetical protein VX583_12750 [Bdellovibrionota bacterium]|nr:hypothetical protein [Pseudobdellovibrionaceae bacterium]|tara:strand:+ start:34825 stop:35700 length:876 start_codon:yes stop_codon:yes gene_type:complete